MNPKTTAELVESQRTFFNSNATKPVEFRIAQLRLLRAILKKNERAICEAIKSDYGKSEFDSFLTEFLVIYDDLAEAGWAATTARPGSARFLITKACWTSRPGLNPASSIFHTVALN
jgi:acyl-CoA reductase-like NAD-dependent aldehyde dehydrogenase